MKRIKLTPVKYTRRVSPFRMPQMSSAPLRPKTLINPADFEMMKELETAVITLEMVPIIYAK